MYVGRQIQYYTLMNDEQIYSRQRNLFISSCVLLCYLYNRKYCMLWRRLFMHVVGEGLGTQGKQIPQACYQIATRPLPLYE
jgi:hypothetical protein